MKLFFATLLALVLGVMLFGCLGGGQQTGPTPTSAPTIAPTASPVAGQVDVSQANKEIDDALGALGDASNASSDLDLGDMNSSDLDYVG